MKCISQELCMSVIVLGRSYICTKKQPVLKCFHEVEAKFSIACQSIIAALCGYIAVKVRVALKKPYQYTLWYDFSFRITISGFLR